MSPLHRPPSLPVHTGPTPPAVQPERLTADERFLVLAQAASAGAECTRGQYGAVLVSEHGLVVGTGANGAPTELTSCLDGGCPRGRTGQGGCPSVHAEVKALVGASDRARGGTLYASHAPCPDCLRLLAHAGVVKAMWPGGACVPRVYLSTRMQQET